MNDAQQRLEQSRARMRGWMQSTRRRRDDTRTPGTPQSPPSWLDVIGEIPIVGAAVSALRSAWRDSPLPAAVQLAEDAGNAALRPTAQQHPLALVGIAMAGGAFLLWARPWRTLLRSALFAGLASQLTARLVSQIPIGSMLDAVQDFAAARRPASADAADAPATYPDQEGLRHSG